MTRSPARKTPKPAQKRRVVSVKTPKQSRKDGTSNTAPKRKRIRVIVSSSESSPESSEQPRQSDQPGRDKDRPEPAAQGSNLDPNNNVNETAKPERQVSVSDTENELKVTVETSTAPTEQASDKQAEVEQLQIDLHLSDSDFSIRTPSPPTPARPDPLSMDVLVTESPSPPRPTVRSVVRVPTKKPELDPTGREPKSAPKSPMDALDSTHRNPIQSAFVTPPRQPGQSPLNRDKSKDRHSMESPQKSTHQRTPSTSGGTPTRGSQYVSPTITTKHGTVGWSKLATQSREPREDKPKESWPCEFCPKVLGTYSSLKRHRKETHFKDQWRYICSQCERKFSRHQNLRDHVEKYHGKYDHDKGIMITTSFEPRKLASPPREAKRPWEAVPTAKQVYGNPTLEFPPNTPQKKIEEYVTRQQTSQQGNQGAEGGTLQTPPRPIRQVSTPGTPTTPRPGPSTSGESSSEKYTIWMQPKEHFGTRDPRYNMPRYQSPYKWAQKRREGGTVPSSSTSAPPTPIAPQRIYPQRHALSPRRPIIESPSSTSTSKPQEKPCTDANIWIPGLKEDILRDAGKMMDQKLMEFMARLDRKNLLREPVTTAMYEMENEAAGDASGDPYR